MGSENDSPNEFEQLDIHEAKKLMERTDVTIVDIRDEESFKEAHIPAAVSVGDDTLKSFLEKVDKKKPLVCYCYHGHSSQSAARYFRLQGFEKVVSIIGGFESWRTIYSTIGVHREKLEQSGD